MKRDRSGEEQDRELLTRLEAIYAHGALQTPADLAALIVAGELETVSADTAFVATLSQDGTRVEVSRVTTSSEAPVHLAFPANAPYPIAAVLRRRATLYIESNEQLACDHPGLVRVDAADHACATMPLRSADGRMIGALNLGFESPRTFSEAERAAIQILAGLCADALDQALAAA